MANVWPATQSQLYGELNKLSDAGLIEVANEGPRGRKEYTITAAGRRELARWVSDASDDPPYRNASLLRVFLLDAIPADQARSHMVAEAESAEFDLRRYEKLRGSVPWEECRTDDFYGRAALEFGLRHAAMRAEWARLVAAQIEGRTDRD